MAAASEFVPLNLAILTISDSRGACEDSSGQFLVDAALEAGHSVVARRLLHDDTCLMRALVSRWIADPHIQSILITGGTGLQERDSTPESLGPLFDKTVEGFGEEFRRLSAQEIGNSTIQSRALAGLANHTVVFCMPGSTGACRTAWEGIVRDQLDSRHRPCNFAALIQRKPEKDLSGLDQPIPLDAARGAN
ncbi:molybdenum cofactor biosynthesis protein B [Salicola sp. Rm-C-2C1-2]|uniref:molybdenum cofactor biosynthesis protein B n=1 Tax=Salicola sp. Rm-C-2C1-2 TaxID=3141321 RepID=UPI0032E42B7F